jgi:uncharacterized tellurite resistance protein B-like protein
MILDRIAEFLSTGPVVSEPRRSRGHGIELAAAVLMVEVMGADFDASLEERARTLELMREQFALEDTEARELVHLAEMESQRSTSLRSFTRKLVDKLDLGEREALLESLWSVAYADGRIDKYEEHLVRRIADLLYLPHAAFIRAKQRAAPRG